MADFYGFRELGEDGEAVRRRFNAMVDDMNGLGSTWIRATIVSAEYPKLGYADGQYMEGWRVRPATEPPFEFPSRWARSNAQAGRAGDTSHLQATGPQ